MAKKETKPVHHVQMTDGKRAIIQQLFKEYDIPDSNDIQDALKDLLGGTIQEMKEMPGATKIKSMTKQEQSKRQPESSQRNRPRHNHHLIAS